MTLFCSSLEGGPGGIPATCTNAKLWKAAKNLGDSVIGFLHGSMATKDAVGLAPCDRGPTYRAAETGGGGRGSAPHFGEAPGGCPHGGKGGKGGAGRGLRPQPTNAGAERSEAGGVEMHCNCGKRERQVPSPPPPTLTPALSQPHSREPQKLGSYGGNIPRVRLHCLFRAEALYLPDRRI